MKNGKAKALSHHHDPVSTPSCPELILHPSMVLAQIRWDIKEEIQWAQTTEPPPSACPPSKLFVRPALHPSSKSYNTILLAIDRFSKACQLVPLKGLPSAMEMATTLIHQVFHNYDLPEDIVSNRGPQYTSRVWTAFCT
ncbi:hypothetical protein QTP86_002632 [Hemibagrus guttatus]|nr:hypothetical protein QTP86_002632 [Hemibagrus guttatus]